MSNKMMTVLLVEPEKTAREAVIDSSLKGMQAIVGGTIQVMHPFKEQAALVCNDEGKMNSMPLNRALYDEKGTMYDIVAGTFFVCGLNEDSLDSLSPELMEQFMAEFRNPETFVRLNGKLTAVEVDGDFFNKDSPSVGGGIDEPGGR